jgi:hypothetical protein
MKDEVENLSASGQATNCRKTRNSDPVRDVGRLQVAKRMFL